MGCPQEYTWTGMKMKLLDSPINFQVFDYDGMFSRADKLGNATITLASTHLP